MRSPRTKASTVLLAVAAVVATGLPAALPAAGAASVDGCAPTPAPRTRITQDLSRQVILMKRTKGSKGRFVRFQFRPRRCAWVVMGRATGIFGKNGVVPADERVKNSGTTPAGRFKLLWAFGVHDPGTKMQYERITDRMWWDERGRVDGVLNPTFNERIYGRHGCTRRHCEHLIDYTPARGGYQYRQAVVTGYNTNDPKILSGGGSGSGIFLHYAEHYTDGCVAINDYAELRRTVAWLNPKQDPVIVIRG